MSDYYVRRDGQGNPQGRANARQASILDSIRSAFGADDSPRYHGPAGSGGVEQPRRPFDESSPGQSLSSWYHRSGMNEGSQLGYRVGSDRELEELLATQLGWDGEQGLYEFLSGLYNEGKKYGDTIAPGMDQGRAAQVFRSLLSNLLYESEQADAQRERELQNSEYARRLGR